MNKRAKLVVAILVCITVLFTLGSALADGIKIYYNGNLVEFDRTPVIINDRTMVSAEEFLTAAEMPYEKDETGALTAQNIGISENEPVADGDVLPTRIDGTLYMPVRAFLEALKKKVTWDDAEKAVIITDEGQTEELFAEAQKVKDGSKAAIAVIHDDGGKATGRWLVKVLPKYNINATVGIIGRSIDPEYNVNEPDNFEKWQVILADSDGRLNFAVHSHGHRYLGETDEAESGVLSDGKEFNYEAGHMTKDIADERARINVMFPEERLLAFVKPGTLYPEGKKQVSDAAMAMIKEHYIAMRNTGGEVDTLPPEDIYSVKSLMGTSRKDYNDDANHTAEYWIAKMDEAVENNGLLVYLFHDIADESSANGNSTARTRVEMLLKAMNERIDAGAIWNGKFDEIMQYTQEFNAITDVKAVNYPQDNKITVKVSDSISKIDTDLVGTKFEGLDMFDYPITVKVELPYDWAYAKLTQSYNDRLEILKPFEENGKRYIYANVVPDQEEAVVTEAAEGDYISGIALDGAEIEGFEPSKFYYKKMLPEGTSAAPTVSVSNSNAEIEQAELDENGEGSAFITLGKLRYEVYFFSETAKKEVLFKIDTSRDDENLTATRKVIEYFGEKGITANIIDADAYEKLKDYENVKYCDQEDLDNCSFDFDDEYTEEVEGDYMPAYNLFVQAYRDVEDSKVIMTIHPENKNERLFSIFKDQIEFMEMQGALFL